MLSGASWNFLLPTYPPSVLSAAYCDDDDNCIHADNHNYGYSGLREAGMLSALFAVGLLAQRPGT